MIILLQPVRPPRRQKAGGGDSYGYSGSQSSDTRHYSSLSFRRAEPSERQHGGNPTEKYYFGAPVTVRKYPGPREGGGGGGLGRSYSSVQNLHQAGRGAEDRGGAATLGPRRRLGSSTGSLHRAASGSVASHRPRAEQHHLLVTTRDKPRPEHRWGQSPVISMDTSSSGALHGRPNHLFGHLVCHRIR